MQLSSNLALDEATRHVLFHHHQTSGWITLANKEKKREVEATSLSTGAITFRDSLMAGKKQ